MERQVGLRPGDAEGGHRLPSAVQGLRPVGAVGAELGQQRIVERRHGVARLVAGVYPDAVARARRLKDVYLALDPEFAMPTGIIPGRKIGRMTARDVNTAIDFLEQVIRTRHLPPKVLIVHQFTMKMLADKQNIRDSALVDVVLDMDGFGDRPLKRAIYAMVNRQRQLEFAAIKLFYKEDTNLFAPKEVMALRPDPAVVIYQ